MSVKRFNNQAFFSLRRLLILVVVLAFGILITPKQTSAFPPENHFTCSASSTSFYWGVTANECLEGFEPNHVLCTGAYPSQQPCGNSLECDLACTSLAEDPIARGESCASRPTECASGTVCTDGVCLYPGNVGFGQSCITDFECGTGIPGTAGSPGAKMTCSPETKRCVEMRCTDDAYCQTQTGNATARCWEGMCVVNDTPQATPLPPFDYCGQVPESQQVACRECIAQGEIDDYGNPIGNLYTAVGCVRVDEQGLAADLIQLLLGMAGGVALLSILAGAFLLTTSQGESGRVKQAKELITAAVTGLLLIIFVVIILDFIGVKVLQIPGLG